MGNLFTKQNNAEKTESRSFGQVIDYIASHYILTMDFESLTKLYDKQYCDNLVVITKDIIERNFNDLEITYLAQRTQKGVVIDKEATDKVIFFNKQDLEKLDIGSALKKKRICIGIAKFYVKIAHLFAAIIKTINPVYSYKNEQGQMVKKPLSEKGEIPQNVGRKLYKLGLCNSRIDILKGKQDWNKISVEGDITLNPRVCGANQDVGNLNEEPGIPELMNLYCDKPTSSDNFQTTCDFTTMSDRAKKDYLRDLKTFYTTFTGETDMPADIQSFSQIKLQNYNLKKGCQGEAVFNKSYNGNLKDELFNKYANNLRDMIQHANQKQQQLLDIINELFTYDVVDEKKLIRVKPTLTEEILQGLVEKTRQIIVDLYVTCEEDFETGVKLYEAIVEKQILLTTEAQIKELDKVAQETVSAVAYKKPDSIAPIVAVQPPQSFPISTHSESLANEESMRQIQEIQQEQVEQKGFAVPVPVATPLSVPI